MRLLTSWLPAVGLMAVIWTLSSFNLSGVTLSSVPFKDKGAHFLAYGALGFWVAHAVRATWLKKNSSRGRVFRSLLFSWVVTFAWGLLDELHQAYVPGRDPEALDLVADALGASVGAKARYALAWTGWGQRILG